MSVDDEVLRRHVLRRHKKEDEIRRRRNRLGESVLKKLSGTSPNLLSTKDYGDLVEYLFCYEQELRQEALDRRRFEIDGLVCANITGFEKVPAYHLAFVFSISPNNVRRTLKKLGYASDPFDSISLLRDAKRVVVALELARDKAWDRSWRPIVFSGGACSGGRRS